MFCLIMLFFACNKNTEWYQGVVTEYFIKNTSNQTINFDLTVPKGEEQVVTESHGYVLTSDSVYTFTVNANDSIIFYFSDSNLEDSENHLKWFTKFDILPVNGIQMNDAYLPENWVEYKSPYSNAYGGVNSTAYLFVLNQE